MVFQQHVASKKHLNKQNNAVGAKPRHSPYPMKSPRTTGSYRVNTVATRQTFTNSSPSTFQRRTVNSSYDSSIGSYSLSSSFVSSGIYGNGQGYSNHQPYSRNSYQTHTVSIIFRSTFKSLNSREKARTKKQPLQYNKNSIHTGISPNVKGLNLFVKKIYPSH